MKKIIAILTVAALILSATSVFAASTATSVYNEEKSTETDQYFITSGKIENGGSGFVTLLVTKDGTITVDNIMYIDQTVADENGNFSFTNYIPKDNVPKGGKYTVKVGATSLNTPISGGYLEIPEAPVVVPGYPVTGNVNFKGDLTKATLTLTSGDKTVASIESANGKFSIENIPDGTYTLTVKKAKHLPATVEVTVNGGTINVPEIELLAGDCNNDLEIGYADLAQVIAIYGYLSTNEYYDDTYDVNEDGEVGYTDLSAIIANYGKYIATE
ncbi:MAG: hypothetical protein IKV86_02490 [Clostridia bacterium]|nr:hypothetical protein [Clostridia bacterium]